MFKWINSIQNAIKGVKTNRKEAKRKKSGKQVSKDGKNLSIEDDESKLNSIAEPTILHCETKNRPRGPAGRRPPARKNLHLKQSNGSLNVSDTMNDKVDQNDSALLPTIIEKINLAQIPTAEATNVPSAARVSIIDTPERINRTPGSIDSDRDHRRSTPRFSSNFCDEFSNLPECNELGFNMSFFSATNSPSKVFENGLPIVPQTCDSADQSESTYKDKLSNLVNWIHSVPGNDISKHSAQIKKDLKSMDTHLISIHHQLDKLKKSVKSLSSDQESNSNKSDECVDEITRQTNTIQQTTVQLASSLDVIDENLKLIMESIKDITCNPSLNTLPELVV